MQMPAKPRNSCNESPLAFPFVDGSTQHRRFPPKILKTIFPSPDPGWAGGLAENLENYLPKLRPVTVVEIVTSPFKIDHVSILKGEVNSSEIFGIRRKS